MGGNSAASHSEIILLLIKPLCVNFLHKQVCILRISVFKKSFINK